MNPNLPRLKPNPIPKIAPIFRLMTRSGSPYFDLSLWAQIISVARCGLQRLAANMAAREGNRSIESDRMRWNATGDEGAPHARRVSAASVLPICSYVRMGKRSPTGGG